MHILRSLPVLLVAMACAGVALMPASASAQDKQDKYGIGTPATPMELHETGLSVSPDGRGLPPGKGTAQQGAFVFSQRRCPTCHGPTGQEGPGPRLVYEKGRTFDRNTTYEPPSMWPFAPSLWDFINRAMPFDQPGWLSSDEVYALTAFLLHGNGIIGETDVMDAQTLPRVQMPNRAAYDPAQADWKPGTPRGFVNK
jgi:cytochrome c